MGMDLSQMMAALPAVAQATTEGVNDLTRIATALERIASSLESYVAAVTTSFSDAANTDDSTTTDGPASG